MSYKYIIFSRYKTQKGEIIFNPSNFVERLLSTALNLIRITCNEYIHIYTHLGKHLTFTQGQKNLFEFVYLFLLALTYTHTFVNIYVLLRTKTKWLASLVLYCWSHRVVYYELRWPIYILGIDTRGR